MTTIAHQRSARLGFELRSEPDEVRTRCQAIHVSGDYGHRLGARVFSRSQPRSLAADITQPGSAPRLSSGNRPIARLRTIFGNGSASESVSESAFAHVRTRFGQPV